MKLIAAVDHNWAIGKNGDLLVRLSMDMKHFRNMTTSHVVVMGRKTLESFPGKKPLPNRINIVLTTDREYANGDAIVVHSEEELLTRLKSYPSDSVFIIGGGSIYQMLLDQCNTAYITQISKSYDADTWFPNLDQHPEWVLAEQSETYTENDTDFCFKIYKKGEM